MPDVETENQNLQGIIFEAFYKGPGQYVVCIHNDEAADNIPHYWCDKTITILGEIKPNAYARGETLRFGRPLRISPLSSSWINNTSTELQTVLCYDEELEEFHIIFKCQFDILDPVPGE